MSNSGVIIYTDGSCNTRTCLGGWAAIILFEQEKTVLQGLELHTTHNRMEIRAVIKAIEFSIAKYPDLPINIFTDSQYVAGLPGRKEKLVPQKFITKKGTELKNADLIQNLFMYLASYPITFVKVKAHQKNTGSENLNREADMICRKIMRTGI